MSEDSEKIRIVGAYSITKEAFENLADVSHMSVFDFVNESIVQEEEADSIDQTDQNTFDYLIFHKLHAKSTKNFVDRLNYIFAFSTQPSD